MTRIFLTSSHFSTLLMTAYAQSTPGAGNDFLILDAARRKLSNARQIKMVGSLHAWKDVLDFSETFSNEDEVLPGLRKKLTWRLKHLPGIRIIYNVLLRNHNRKNNQGRKKELLRLIGAVNENEPVQLFLLKETVLNTSLIELFSNATVSYFEHGLSDYLLMVNDPPKANGHFYCVFSEAFKRFLEKRKIDAGYVRALTGESFVEICRNYFSHYPELKLLLQEHCPPGKKYALLILQPFENIQVNSNCWEGFLDKCTRITGKEEGVHYIIKPHPRQSKKETETVEKYLADRGIPFSISAGDTSVISIELAFFAWKDSITYVFSPYSSGVFYLSELFSNGQTAYYFAYEYARPFMRFAPDNHYRLYDTAGPLIKEVFSEKCTEI